MRLAPKYRMKQGFLIGYIIILCCGLLLTAGRWLGFFIPDFVILHPEIHAHISNFSLSLLFYLFTGSTWLLLGVQFRAVTVFSVFLILANIVCETLMGFINTPDILDAVYGTAGVALSFLFLLTLNKNGLVPVSSEET